MGLSVCTNTEVDAPDPRSAAAGLVAHRTHRQAPPTREVHMDFGSSPFVLGCLAVVAVVAMTFVKEASRRSLLHKERMSAIDKGVPLPEDLLAEAGPDARQKTTAQNAAMQGIIWAALGLGMMAAS